MNKTKFGTWKQSLLVVTLGSSLMLTGCGGGSPPPKDQKKTETPPVKTVEPAKTQPVKELGPLETLQAFQKRMQAGDVVAVWDFLTPSQQGEATSLVKDFANKMDPEIWNQVFGVVSKLNTVAGDKKDVFVELLTKNVPQLSKKEDAVFAYEQGLVVLKTLNHETLSKLDNLKKFDGPVFVKSIFGSINKVGNDVYAKLELPGKEETVQEMMKNTSFALLKQEGDKATIKVIRTGKEPSEKEMVKVEGKWILLDVKNNFDDGVERARKTLEGLTKENMAAAKQQMTLFVSMLNSTLDSMDKAETPDQMKNAIQSGMASFLPLMGVMDMPGMSPPQAIPSPNPSPNGSVPPPSTQEKKPVTPEKSPEPSKTDKKP